MGVVFWCTINMMVGWKTPPIIFI